MALIGKIRNNSWLLIVLLGLALGSFIIMDMMSSQNRGGTTDLKVGEVNGTEIDWRNMQRVEQALGSSGGNSNARRNAIWDFFVEEAIISEEADALGLSVSKDELMELQFGTNLSPIISQRFTNPSTRQVNREQLDNIKDAIASGQLNDQYRAYWAHQEKEVIKDRLQSKLSIMVSKALYTPSWMAELVHADQSEKVNFEYVKVPFDEIDDADVTLEESDYSRYLEEHKAQYLQKEESRKIEYVVFDVIPTAEDSAKISEILDTLILEFKTTENDTIFVENNYGSMEATYFKKDKLAEAIKDTVFSMEKGSIYGPYLEGNAYRAVKILDKKIIADSVQARHILQRATDQIGLQKAVKTIDSLKTLIEAGTHSFDSLAITFSQDFSNASKGGVLDYAAPGQYVAPFNDVVFYTGEKGKLYPVITQFGVHLIEIMDAKYETNEEGVQLAYLSQTIMPSEETQNEIFEKAGSFLSTYTSVEQLTSESSKAGYVVETSPGLKASDFNLGTLGSEQVARDIIRWAFEPSQEIGDISSEIHTFQDPVDYYANKYVLVSLKSIQKEGTPKIDNIRDEIQALVVNAKKGEILKGKISGTNLSAIASQFTTQVDTASNVSFNASFVPGMGNEPKIIAEAFMQQANGTPVTIVGNSGVYIVKVIDKEAASGSPNIAQIRRSNSTTVQGEVRSKLMQTMRDAAEIEDNRSTFY